MLGKNTFWRLPRILQHELGEMKKEWTVQIKCKNESVCTWEMDLQSDKTNENGVKEKIGVRICFCDWENFHFSGL